MSGARHSVQRFRRAGRLELLDDIMSYYFANSLPGDASDTEFFLCRYEGLKVRPGSTPVNPLNKEQRAALKLLIDDCLINPEDFAGKYADAYKLMKDLV